MANEEHIAKLKEGVQLWNEWRAFDNPDVQPDLNRIDLSGHNLFAANLSTADLSGAKLRRTLLRDADLHDANLFEADLSGADLTGANLLGADLRGAILSGAILFGADLRYTARRGVAGGVTRVGVLRRAEDVLEPARVEHPFAPAFKLLPGGLLQALGRSGGSGGGRRAGNRARLPEGAR